MARAPSDAEFATWLTPGDALKQLPADWSERTKRNAIIRAIREDALVALARTASSRGPEGVKRGQLSGIDPRLWDDPWVREERDFWEAGDIEFWVPRPTEILFRAGLDRTPGDDAPLASVTLRDVRIDPASFAREFAGHLQRVAPESAPASEPKRAPPTMAPTAGEFANWLTPPDALASLDSSWSFDTKKNWILRRLANGKVKAATEKGPIHSTMWGLRWHWYGNDFWQTGDLTFFDGPADHFERPIPDVRCTKVEMQGVRFDPAGLPRPIESESDSRPVPSGTELKSVGNIVKGASKIDAAEFETWLRPVAVLAMFEGTNFHAVAKAVQEGLIATQIVAAAETLTMEGATIHRAPIPASLWVGWYSQTDLHFWVTGDHVRLMADRHGVIDPDRRIELFGVRFEPKVIEALLPERPKPSAGSAAPGRRGGRRPRTTGEPIARVVKRLLALPASDLASYKVDALTADLMAEFRALGLDPPHEDNVKRDASGILRALREGGAT